MTTEETPVPPAIPFSRQAEEALLGAVLINPDAYFDVAHFLHADDFYVHRQRLDLGSLHGLAGKTYPARSAHAH